MSDKGMRPCADPSICGVQNHRDGTFCRARGGGIHGLARRSRKLAPQKGEGGVRPSVSLGGGGPKINIEDSQQHPSGHTFADIEPEGVSDDADVGMHRFEADEHGNWTAKTRVGGLNFSERSDDVRSRMTRGEYEGFLREQYPNAEMEFGDAGGDAFIETRQNADDVQGDLTADHVSATFVDENQQMLDDIESGDIDDHAVEYASGLDEKWRYDNNVDVDAVGGAYRDKMRRESKKPRPDDAAEAEYEDTNDNFTKSLQNAGIRAHYERQKETSYGNLSRVWLSRVDENGEEQSVSVSYTKGVALDPNPNPQEVVSALLNDEDYRGQAHHVISREEERAAEDTGYLPKELHPDAITWKEDEEIRVSTEGLNRVLGDHYDDVRTAWEDEHDWQ